MGRLVGAVFGFLVSAFVFQVFFRYAYLHQGARLVRLDRLTQQTCVVQLVSAADSGLPTPPPDLMLPGEPQSAPKTVYCPR